MSNRRLYQFLFSKQPKLTMINGLVNIGATGAVGTIVGAGVQGVTRLNTGIYQVKLVDNYCAIVGYQASMYGGITGGSVTAGSFVTGTLYQILTLGTTNYVSAGYDSDFTPVVGGVFVATGAGAGTGTVKAIGASGIQTVEMAQVQSSQLVNNFATSGRGSAFVLQTLKATDSSTTTLIPGDPASGSQLAFKIWFRDSNITVK